MCVCVCACVYVCVQCMHVRTCVQCVGVPSCNVYVRSVYVCMCGCMNYTSFSGRGYPSCTRF